MATDVYIYPAGEYVPALSVKDMQCITFCDEGIRVTDILGQSHDLPYESFDYLRFYPTQPTGLQSVSLTGRTGLYSLTGVYYGEGEEVANQLPAGVYLIREKVNGKETVRKVLKK